ncbi:MAG: Adaptive-response sensory-kinase SasA [Steroidobacteraceae bacterium]|nr:Adaptive-response sensory-kinase SasA [Steroidobacteraceae bacterium]
MPTSASRLAMIYGLLFAAGVAALIASVYFLTAQVLARDVDNVIDAEFDGLRDDFATGGLSALAATLDRRAGSWGRNGAVYLLVGPNDEPLAGNLTAWPFSAEPATARVEFAIVAHEGHRTTTHPVRALLEPIDASHRLLVGTDVTDRQHFLGSLRMAAAWSVGLAALLAAALAYLYERRVTARVGALAATCRQIMDGDLSRRLATRGTHDEFDRLATAVNSMLERIEHQTRAVKATFDSAAHDLRAPLHRARMRLESRLADPGVPAAVHAEIESAVGDIDRVQETLATLLQIAEAESGVAGERTERLDLGALAAEVVTLYEPLALESGLALEAHCAPAWIMGTRQLLAQLIANLLENAIKYVPRGGRLKVETSLEGQVARLDVIDDGPGIADGERERALAPFGRLERDAQLPGSGLGLALVAAIARLHGGKVQLEDGTGGGLRVRCELPAAPPA